MDDSYWEKGIFEKRGAVLPEEDEQQHDASGEDLPP